MKKFVLGLDIGTNSIGWTLFIDGKIADGGIVIFPIGTNVNERGIESTKNMERRGYRGASRNHFRYKLRRKDLKRLLKHLGLLPDFSKTYKVKKKGQAAELYKLRAEALDIPIPPEEIGRIFLLINKHRGFKSNSKTLNVQDEEEGKVKEGIGQLRALMVDANARTVGEYFHKMYDKAAVLFAEGKWHNVDEPFDERAIDEEGYFSLHNNRGIRREHGRYVGREMYEKEFDLIWDKQKGTNPLLTGSRKEYDAIQKLQCGEKVSCHAEA